MPTDVTKDNFDKEVTECEQPVLVEFWAAWCGHCKAYAPVIDEVSKDMEGQVKVCKVEVDDNPELSEEFEVRSIPTLFLIKNGEIVDRIEGALPKEKLEEKLQAL